MSEMQEGGVLKDRVESIDVLRGFDMFWIIGGGAIFGSLHKVFGNGFTEVIQTQLKHVPWEGFVFEDLIMPLFMFIVGVVMPYSFSRRLDRGDSELKLLGHVLLRCVILFFLGMVAQGNLLDYDLSRLHIYCNTLQAIAAGYLIASLIVFVLPLIGQVIAFVVLLLLFWGFMMLAPVPDHGPGVLTAEGNFAMYIDRLILGGFQDGTTYTWILSSMTFATTVLMGVFAGLWLRSDKSGYAKAGGLVLAGMICIGAGLGWGIAFPIIKHLWTSSFVLLSGGVCLVLLGQFYLVIDVWGLKKWAFGFKVIGMNAIFVYMATHLWNFRNIGGVFVRGLRERLGPWQGFIEALAAFAVVWLILLFMYRKKIFVKI